MFIFLCKDILYMTKLLHVHSQSTGVNRGLGRCWRFICCVFMSVICVRVCKQFSSPVQWPCWSVCSFCARVDMLSGQCSSSDRVMLRAASAKSTLQEAEVHFKYSHYRKMLSWITSLSLFFPDYLLLFFTLFIHIPCKYV